MNQRIKYGLMLQPFKFHNRIEDEIINSDKATGEEKPYLLLANAIIIRAVRDYEEGIISEEAFIRFIKSDYFTVLSRGCVAPEKIIKEIVEPCRKRENALTRCRNNLTKI